MSELRYRPPETATVPDRPRHPDSPRRPDRQVTERPAPDAHDDGADYDADAQFKHPVAKPDGYLPDDTGGAALAPAAPRARGEWFTRRDDPNLARRKDPSEAPALREVTDADRPDRTDRTDRVRVVVDHPDFHVPTDSHSPDRYGDPLSRPDGTRVPCLDGPPRREETRQGWAGDCGIIATLGAVAAHQPENITRRMRTLEDGSCQVTLSEARQCGGVTEPTGREIELTITPDLPIRDDDPGTPACAKVQGGTSWCAVMEKAFAGVDQTWTTERWASWQDDWAEMCAQERAGNAEYPRSGLAPTGYVRLHQGTTPWERAEALTQLTGQPAVVREFPCGRDEWIINRIIRAQLADDKPVLVSSREKMHKREVLPHNLEPEHVYEVTGVEKGKILLRNPWNKDHPQPMETDEFARNMSRYYSTLI
jgi:hypothetical protein